MKNPLLIEDNLPNFSIIKSCDFIPAMKSTIKNFHKMVEKLIKKNDIFTWKNFCQPLMELENQLNKVWSIIDHLNSVQHDEFTRSSYEQSLLLLIKHNIWINQNKSLYLSYKRLRNGKYFFELNIEQKKFVDNILKNFKLSGISFSEEKKKLYNKIIYKLSKLSTEYENNVLDATKIWKKKINKKSLLVGIPNKILSSIRVNSSSDESWLLTLDTSIYTSVIKYCNNESLRKEIYYAYNTRASDEKKNIKNLDNSSIMEDILKLRTEQANMFGFKSYAHQSLSIKTAKHPKRVFKFIRNLIKRVKNKAQYEIDQLKEFAKINFNVQDLNPWDIAFYSEKQKNHLYNIDEEKIRCFFPEKKVFSGLFKIIEIVFGYKVIERKNINAWHPSVRLFDFFDNKNRLQGSVYLDLYIRSNKRCGAWMNSYSGKMKHANGKIQIPVAHIVCNFNNVIFNNNSFFTHNDVRTLFHEFGHAIQHILTKIEILGISGTDNIPWDTIEVLSQFMEKYCWDADILRMISEHYKTKDTLSGKLLHQLIETKDYHIALSILRQIEFSLLDLRLHYYYVPNQEKKILDFFLEIKQEISVIPSVSWERFPNTFSHIFSGCYAAGYYSYLWADVLASDVWMQFKRRGILNKDIGISFLKYFISQGSIEDPITLISRFLGRKPKYKYMLDYYNI